MENDDDVTLIFDMDEALDLLVATGFRKPVCSLSKSDCSSIASTLLDFLKLNLRWISTKMV